MTHGAGDTDFGTPPFECTMREGQPSRALPEYFNKEIDRGRRVIRYRLESR